VERGAVEAKVGKLRTNENVDSVTFLSKPPNVALSSRLPKALCGGRGQEWCPASTHSPIWNVPHFTRQAIFSSTNLPRSKFFSYIKHLSNASPHIFHLTLCELEVSIMALFWEVGTKRKHNLQRDAALTLKKSFQFPTWDGPGDTVRPGSHSSAALAKEASLQVAF
jgi:hypothetical protein